MLDRGYPIRVLPASVVADETGIEAVDFRRGNYLSGPTVEGGLA